MLMMLLLLILQQLLLLLFCLIAQFFRAARACLSPQVDEHVWFGESTRSSSVMM
jgi:hypothetical protein